MATSARRTDTPDLEEVMISDSEPEDLSPDEVEGSESEAFEIRNGSERTSTSTPNASLLSPESTCSVPTPHRSFGSCGISGDEDTFMTLLRETNAIVKGFDTRLTALEAKIELLGDKGKGSASTKKKQKAAVSDEIRRETRRVYKKLQTEGDGSDPFLGWSLDPVSTLKTAQNQKTLDILVQEVRAIHSDFSSSAVTDAAKRYYRTCREEESRRRRGVAEQRKEERRKEERISRKRKERAASLEKCNLPEPSKVKWRKLMDSQLMSSEDSDEEETDSGGRLKFLIKRPLPFRSEKVNVFFQKLDDLAVNEKNKTCTSASRMAIPRKIGAPSGRTLTNKLQFPVWAFTCHDQ